MTTPIELVERAQTEDADAFSLLVSLTTPAARATARLILGSDGVADDVLQDVYVRAWRSLKQLRDPARFDAWLRRLVVNACLNQRRSGRRLDAAIRRLCSRQEETPGPEAAVAMRDELERALARLPVEQRALLVLRYGADLSSDEVGKILSIPPAAVRGRIHRAVVRLRIELDAETQQDGHGIAPEAT